jgi:hypothetical protein
MINAVINADHHRDAYPYEMAIYTITVQYYRKHACVRAMSEWATVAYSDLCHPTQIKITVSSQLNLLTFNKNVALYPYLLCPCIIESNEPEVCMPLYK